MVLQEKCSMSDTEFAQALEAICERVDKNAPASDGSLDKTDMLQTDEITESLNRYYKNNQTMPDRGLRQAAYQLFALEDW